MQGVRARLQAGTEREVTLRQLNRWTLTRQMLIERHHLDAVTAIDRLAGMQAQHSPAPFIGLWSRLHDFDRDHLHRALEEDRVLKATLMRGTLHLVSGETFPLYRAVTRSTYEVHSTTAAQFREVGVDVEALQQHLIAALTERPLRRVELHALVREFVPLHLENLPLWRTVSLAGDLVNLAEDAFFGYFGGVRFRPAPQREVDGAEAFRFIVRSYLAAFGPATRADLAQWSGGTVAAFEPALQSLDLITLRTEDGRMLLDLPDAPRPDPDFVPPIRFLPKWDNLLLAYARRERVLPEAYRKIVIRKNGDVLPTFLVDGSVAGTWDAPLKGRAMLTMSPLQPLKVRVRKDVEREAESLLAWLRPDTDKRELRWDAG